MAVLVAIIIGGVVGWLAALMLGRDEGPIASIVIGIIGSLIGGFLSTLVTGANQSYLGFSWVGVFWAFVGSLVLVTLLNWFSGRRTTGRSV